MAKDVTPKSMKAAVCHKIGTPLVTETLPVPKPAAGELLIRVTACGVCHSDLHAIDGDWSPHPNLPLIPGHEVTGHVAALGDGAQGFKVGDQVGVPWMYSSCGSCEFCKHGMETICRSGEATGYSKPGGYAEYMVAPAAFSAKLDGRADLYELAPILCAGVTTYRGLRRAHVRPGQWLAVIGIGGLGHIGLQYARAMGMRVIAVDVDDKKLALAKSLGAELLVNSRDQNAEEVVKREVGGVHGAIVTAVALPAFELSVKLLRPGGTVTWIGIPGGKQDDAKISIASLVNLEASITGSNVGTRADLDEAVAFAANGLVKAKIEKAPLEQANAIFDRMRKGGIVGRVVLAIS